ncbi:MAG: hypothetical protein ACFFG0_48085 [Candidatus Thorarchaeota archaeon]
MDKAKIYKVFISVGLLIICLLPKIDKELYVNSKGSIGSLDIFLAIIFIIGLFKNWKHLKEIVMVLFFLRLIGPIILILPMIIAFDFTDIRIGYVIELFILTIGIFSLIRLRKIDNYLK